MNHNDNPMDSWLKPLFIGVLIAGGVYSIYAYGIKGTTPAETYRNSMEAKFVTAQQETIPERTPQAIANGEKTYASVCFACHGANREGGVGPSLADTTWVHTSNEADLVKLITKGIGPGETKVGQVPMPAKGGRPDLSGEQIWEVVYFLQSKNPSIQKAQ